MKKIENYLRENNLVLSHNAKARKLIENGADERVIAVALMTTKAYKSNVGLRKLCDEILYNVPTPEKDKISESDRFGEPR